MRLERSESSFLNNSSVHANIEFEEGWNQIQTEAINPLETYLLNRTKYNEVNKSLFSTYEYSKIYTLIYNMCTQSPRNWSKELFAKYSETLDTFLKHKVLNKLLGISGVQLLMEFQLAWSSYLIYIHWMERFFGYLNKYYVKISGEGSLMSKGMTIFYDSIYSEIKEQLSISFSESIEQERLGKKHVEGDCLKEIVNICLELSKRSNIPEIYENEIETFLLNNLCSHYTALVSNWINNDTLLEYLERVDGVLKFEETLCNRFLTISTWNKFKKSLIHILLDNEIKSIFSNLTCIRKMFMENKYDQLKLFYKLLSSVNNGTQNLSIQLKNYLLECGQLIISKFSKLINQVHDTELQTIVDYSQIFDSWPWISKELINIPFVKKTPELLFVEVLFTLYNHSMFLMNNCFEKDLLIQKIIKESFEVIVNMDLGSQNQVQLICNYCDYLLREDYWDNERILELERNYFFESTSNRLIEIFSFTHFQDYFLEIYRYNLAKRLLQYHTELEKNELYIISLIRNKCGMGFTSKLEGMIADMRMRQEINDKYMSHSSYITDSKSSNGNNGIYYNSSLETNVFEEPFSNLNFSVSILTSSNWPSLGVSKINLPLQLKYHINKFENFYFSETAHRKLSWIHWYDKCILNFNLRGEFETKSIEIHCNTYQACILLLFNDNHLLSFDQIQNFLLLDTSVLKKHMESLYLETDILLGVDLKNRIENQIFKINERFDIQSGVLTIKIPSQGEMAIKSKIEEDRSHAVEAAIVRIMKIRREMGHEELISYIMSLPNFKMTSKMIASKIKYLIEREYLDIHKEDPSKYIYLV